MSGKQFTKSRSGYVDLGQIISGTNIGAGAIVYSSMFLGFDWVRNAVFMASSDQQYDIWIRRKDTTGVMDWAIGVSTGNASTGSGLYRPTAVQLIMGYSAQFGIKNSSAVANTFANLNCQLMGA